MAIRPESDTGSRPQIEGAVLVTGSAGYIGSHVCLELLLDGYDVIGLDDLRNGSPEAIRRVETLAGRQLLADHVVDVGDQSAVRRVFEEHRVGAVVHLAGLKAVGESVAEPLMYYRTNLAGSLSLLEAMIHAQVTNIVFSSSCTVYGDPPPELVPLTECCPLHPTNPYGRTKLAIEQMLADVAVSEPGWKVVSLRYFNPIGAHESGLIGEDPKGVPNNLMPMVMQVAAGERSEVTIHGSDYPTEDGTCVRDYIHVVDLARAHVRALACLKPGFDAVNLGTGHGSSVLEVLECASSSAGRTIQHRIGPRRPGDAVAVYADPAYALESLGWKAERSLQNMCDDHWRWQSRNPRGYRAPAE